MNERHSLFSLMILLLLAFATRTYGQTTPDHLLLKDYRPESIFRIPNVVVKSAKYKAIDMDSHPYATSQKQLARWVHNMDSTGVRRTIILTDAYGKRFDSLAAYYSHYAKRFILFCGFNLTGYDKPGFGPAAVKELKRCYEEGARGVGELIDRSSGFVHCNPPAYWVHIDDPRLDPLLSECAKLGMPVSIGIGQPQWFYGQMDSTNDGLMSAYEHWFSMGWDLDLEQELQHLAHALASHPHNIFIACHFANQITDLAELGKLFDKYPNIYADISDRYAEMATIPRYVKAFIQRHQDRILYGTDMGFGLDMYHMTFTILQTRDEHFYDFNLFNYHWPLYGLGLIGKTLKRVYWTNAAKLLNIEP